MNVERFITIEYIMDYNLYVIIIPCVIFFTILLLVNNQSLCPICRAISYRVISCHLASKSTNCQGIDRPILFMLPKVETAVILEIVFLQFTLKNGRGWNGSISVLLLTGMETFVVGSQSLWGNNMT